MPVLFAMFCLGVYTLLAQMLVTRELAVLCLGNELTMGVVFSVWLILVGAGAGMSSRFTARACCTRSSVAGRPCGEDDFRSLGLVFLWLALALPVVILLLRLEAGWIRPVGEYVSLVRVVGASVLALAPIGIPAGMMFPAGCEALVRSRGAGVVSRVYAIEALGSVLAGVAFSFVLVGRLEVARITVLAMTVSGAGAAALSRRDRGRGVLVALVVLLAVVGLKSAVLSDLDWRLVERRWVGLGVTCDGREGRPAATLLGGLDTHYQNLALVESQGLFSLYGDGQVMASFPDEIACERAVHFVMAQNPKARRILLLGGNPAGELPFLLQYPVEEVVYVERDPGVESLIQRAVPGLSRRFSQDPRLKRIHDDGPRYVRQCRRGFDVVLVHVPEPVTGSLNRYFTREFYQDVRAILAPTGFMHTSLEASERLEQDASRMAGSIYRTLVSVFPEVKVTAGAPLQFFASGPGAVLSLDRAVLYQRSMPCMAMFKSFNPLYFLDADELAPDKIAFTAQRLRSSDAPVNTVMNPASCYYTLILWSRYSNSMLGAILHGVKRLGAGAFVLAAVFLGACLLAMAASLRRSHPAVLARLGAVQAMAATGFAGVALELIILYAYQGLFGYVYSRMGFMVGLFMLGTVVGSWQSRRIEGAGGAIVRKAVASGLLMLAILAGVVWGILAGGAPSAILLYGLMIAVGGIVGMQFVAASRCLVLAGSGEGAAAGAAWQGDYWGSALGGLLAGVFLPVMVGLSVTCLILAALLIFALGLFLLTAELTPTLPE